MNDIVMVTLRRSVVTDVGEIAAGTTVPATRSLDDGYTLEMSLPGAPSHPFDVPASAVEGGKATLSELWAWDEYHFARDVLDYCHTQACAWVMAQAPASERQMLRWGFRNIRTEVAS
ncbi:MAG TPA: hypothetical protein VIQ30_05405 [Pseudonocardia sp.]